MSRRSPRAGNRIVWVLMATLFAISAGYGIVLPVIPFLIEKVGGAVSSDTGWLTGTYNLALFIFAPIWGRFSDHHGRRILLLGLAGLAFALLLSALQQDLAMLYSSRLLAGAFAAAVSPVVYALVGRSALTDESRAYRFALLNAAAAGGFIVGPMIGGYVAAIGDKALGAEQGQFIAPYLAAAVLVFVVEIAVRLVVPEDTRAASSDQGRKSGDRRPISRLLVVSFSASFAVGAFEVALSLRAKSALHLSASEIGIMFTECSLIMFLVQSLIFSPLIQPTRTRWLVTPAMVVLSGGLFAVPLADGYLGTTLALGTVSASAGILLPIATYWISLSAGARTGAALGWHTAVASLGQAAGSILGGVLFDLAVFPNAPFNLAAVMAGAGALLTLSLARTLGALVQPAPASAHPDGIAAANAGSRRQQHR